MTDVLENGLAFLSRWLTTFMVMVSMGITIVACGPEKKPFPEIDRAKLRITLERSGCFGSCPRYQVSIDGNGNVVFDTGPNSAELGFGDGPDYSTDTGVRVAGKYRAKIPAETVDDLIDEFQSADFFSLNDAYRSEVTDNPTYVVSIDTGNGTKSVVDYAGDRAGMPAAVTRIEEAIDKAARTDRWIKGTPEVIPMLVALDTDFSGVIGLELMDAAAERNDIATMVRLEALGAPLNSRGLPKPQMGWAINPLRSAIIEGHNDAVGWLIRNNAAEDLPTYMSSLVTIVEMDNHGAYRLLTKRIGLELLNTNFKTELLIKAAENADLLMIRDLIEAGASATGVKSSLIGLEPPLFKAANGGVANERSHRIEDRRKAVRLFLEAGAPVVNCYFSYCMSVLSSVDDPIIAEMLINAGANPNFRDDEGEHILFSISEDDVAMVLIAHGADPNAVRPADGMTLGRWARYQGWRRVVDLLNRRGL